MCTRHPFGRIAFLMAIAALLTLPAACLSRDGEREEDQPTVAATTVAQRKPTSLEAVEILHDDSFPVAVKVLARGRFPNDCTIIDQIEQERQGSTFLVTLDSVEYARPDCLDNPVPFEEVIELDLVGLPAGIYVVDVNGLQGTFKLQRDNVPDAGNAILGGQVWHDRCDLIDHEESATAEAAPGCVDLGDGSFLGNGVREREEPGLGRVVINLGAGVCPSIGLATTITDNEGTFLFSGLTAGTYCVSVVGEEGQSGLLQAKGEWTYPSDGQNQATVDLEPGGSELNLSFGWSPLSRPGQTVYLPVIDDECTNKALFIADLTIPDDTPFLPGETFTKTWQLQNLGSCTWDPDYLLVVSAGEAMSATESISLTQTVLPGEMGDLSVKLIAPEVPGTYRGEWKLQSPDGKLFGIGPGSNRPFWVQIVVVEEAPAG